MKEKLRLLRKELLARYCVQHNIARVIDEYSPPIDYIKNQMALDMGKYLLNKEIMKFEDVELYSDNYQLRGIVYATDQKPYLILLKVLF